jgi:hypothetical protein
VTPYRGGVYLMKTRKTIFRVCFVLSIPFVVIAMLLSAYLSAEHQFNIFQGMAAMAKLSLGSTYTALPGERVLIKYNDYNNGNFQNAFFDSWENIDTPVPSGKGVKGGIKYTYTMGHTVGPHFLIIILSKE